MRIQKPLTRRQKKELVGIAWEQVEQFIDDWQKDPQWWYNERDIQVEIANRIKSIYRKRKRDSLWGKYKRGVDKRFFWAKPSFTPE